MSMVETAPSKIQVRNLNFYYGKFHALKTSTGYRQNRGYGVYRAVRLQEINAAAYLQQNV